jgi:hypothetical protein
VEQFGKTKAHGFQQEFIGGHVAPQLLGGTKIALHLKAMQDRVQCSGTDSVTVPIQFLKHPQAKDRLLGCMMEPMQIG